MLRSTVPFLILAALFGPALGCSFADSGVTPDPHGAVPVDPRLAQKVTYEARFKSVGQMMNDLSAMTGIKITAGYNRSDWQVYGRKMNIFVKDVRFSDLMDSIAHTMKFRWGRRGNIDPPVYSVVVDSKAVSEANARKARGDQAIEETWRNRRERWADAIMRDGAKSDSEVDAMRKTDPVFYRVAKIGAARGIHALFEEFPETKDRFLAGQSFRLSIGKLTPNTRDQLLSAANEFHRFMQRGRGQQPAGFAKPLDTEKWMSPVSDWMSIASRQACDGASTVWEQSGISTLPGRITTTMRYPT